MKWPPALRNEACKEGYEYFDGNIRKLPRNIEGSFNESDPIYLNSDVDAFRHAYVSGIFTQEYGVEVADLFGRLNELTTILSPGSSPSEKNMDLWNNATGRKYGQKFKTRRELQKALHNALKSGELIISPSDGRTYEGASHIQLNPAQPVIVLTESQTGQNTTFYDLTKKKVFSRDDFVSMISSGQYPNYSVKEIDGIKTPVSKPNRTETDNLG